MNPDRVLLVDLGDANGGYPMHPERFPGACVEPWRRGRIRTEALEWLLDGCDVVFTAETPYDYRLFEMAAARGVRTVVQGNLEFMRWITEDLPLPDLFLSPSTWHLERWPDRTQLLPFPVCRGRLPFTHRTEARTFLHVGGHPAMQDRNGTRLVLAAAQHLQSEARLVVRAQQRVARSLARGSRRVTLEDGRTLPDYWSVYDGADVVVIPRRFGGQSLPMNEALSLGLPVVSLDVEPQREFLPRSCLVPAHSPRMIRTQGGEVAWYDARPEDLAHTIDALASDPAIMAAASAAADRTAQARSWEHLGPQYTETFAALLESDQQPALA